MRGKTADRDDAALRAARQIRQRRGRQFVERGGHHRERPLQAGSRQIDEPSLIGKARGMHDRVDRPKGRPRGGDEFGRGAFPGEVAGTPLDYGAGPLAFRCRRL